MVNLIINRDSGVIKMKVVKFLTVMFMAVLGVCPVWGANGVLPGSGTEADPYLIEDLADFARLIDFGKSTSTITQSFKLLTDIDMSEMDSEYAILFNRSNAIRDFGGSV